MHQIKEKAPATPDSVTSAKDTLHIKDTIKSLIRQADPVRIKIEDLYYMLMEESPGYSDSPELIKALHEIAQLLAAEVGKEKYREQFETRLLSAFELNERQGFIYGFRSAVSLLTSIK
mgnify:CR=1 FL=1